MKKLISFLVILSAIFSFAVFGGCDNQEANTHEPPTSDEEPNDEIEYVPGKIYTLRQAYDNGFLTIEDLQNIQNATAETLSKETEFFIRQTVVNDINHELGDNSVGLKDVNIYRHYGLFNNCVAVKLLVDTDGDGEIPVNAVIGGEEIGGVYFNYSDYTTFIILDNYALTNGIMIWKADGADQSSNSNIAMGFYTLQEAYDKGYLNKSNLEDIATYINSENVYSELKDDAVVSLIKECATKRIREREIEPVLEAKAEGFTIIGYYGKYADWHVARVRNIYDLHPEDIPDYWREIGGVNFHITSYDMIGCCK